MPSETMENFIQTDVVENLIPTEIVEKIDSPIDVMVRRTMAKFVSGVYMNMGLFGIALFYPSMAEEDPNFNLAEIMNDNLLHGLDSELKTAHLPEHMEKELRLWGFTNIVKGVLVTASMATGERRKKVLNQIINSATNYANQYFQEELKSPDFWRIIID